MKQMMMAVEGVLGKVLLGMAVMVHVNCAIHAADVVWQTDGPEMASGVHQSRQLITASANSSFLVAPLSSDILFVTDKNSKNKGQLGDSIENLMFQL